MVQGKGRLGGVLAVAAVALTLLGAFTALTLSDADAASHRRGPDQTRLLLRLSDLPLGYLNLELLEEQDDRIFCSQLTHPDDTPPKLNRFILRFHPRGCIAAYYRLFTLPGTEPGPKVLASGALALGSDRAADAGWSVVPELLGRLFGDRPPKEVKAGTTVGSATRLFHATIRSRALGHHTSFLVWRSGNTLAVVETSGPNVAENDRQAAELARLQQAHLEMPTRYTLAERFDGEVPLDDPAIDLPVYWLGRNFRPGGDLPENRLFDSGFSTPIPETHEGGFAEGPYAPLNIRYENIRLGTWTPATWHVFTDSKTSRAITAWKCTKTRTIAVAEGSATIFGGYKENFRRCPKKAPQAFTAWVDVGGVKVVVNAPPAPDFIETSNPYGSFAGMEAIVRSLVLRPQRTG
ncbi:MAG TPA: hypothetical protein VFJ65_05675 [Solirubrobacterales bacterium]|nr:hypothetical protein [Solirubrobacterales bacterium]